MLTVEAAGQGVAHAVLVHYLEELRVLERTRQQSGRRRQHGPLMAGDLVGHTDNPDRLPSDHHWKADVARHGVGPLRLVSQRAPGCQLALGQ